MRNLDAICMKRALESSRLHNISPVGQLSGLQCLVIVIHGEVEVFAQDLLVAAAKP